MPTLPTYLSAQDLAKICGISLSGAYALMKKIGYIDAPGIGKRVKYDDFKSFVAEHQHPAEFKVVPPVRSYVRRASNNEDAV